MTYWEYQQYLADGGWQAVSMHNQRISGLEEKLDEYVIDWRASHDELAKRVEALEEDRFIQRIIAGLLVAVVCAAFILLMTGTP